MNRASHAGATERKSGIAIVLVLGLLSLIMVLAVAFAITMRVERMAAGNYTRTIYAKHLTWAALGRAMEAIDQHMSSSTDPFVTSSNSVLYPEWDVFVSGPAGVRVIEGTITCSWDDVIVPTLAQLKYVPDSLTNQVAGKRSAWEEIVDVGSDNGVAGRCAYLVVNTSGFLDANKVGGSPSRGYGTNASEIRLYDVDNPGGAHGLPDIVNVANVNTFINQRNIHKRYENLPELRTLNSVFVSRGGANSSFTTFSMAPEQSYLLPDRSLGRKVNIGGPVADLVSQRASILSALQLAGIPNAQARGTAYSNLLDYVDTDDIPRSLGVGCVEQTPMISEVTVTCTSPDGAQWLNPSGNFTLDYQVRVKWVYPFEVPSRTDFKVKYEYKLSPAPHGNPDWGDIQDDVFVGGAGGGEFILPKAQLNTRGSGFSDVGTNITTWGPRSAGNTNGVRAMNMKLKFVAKVKACILAGPLYADPQDMVDCVPYAPPKTYTTVTDDKWIQVESGDPDPKTLVIGQDPGEIVAWSECVDPRFNWNPTADGGLPYDQWILSQAEYDNNDPGEAYEGLTPDPDDEGVDNQITRYFLSHPAKFSDNCGSLFEQNADGDTYMYVSNSQIRTVGELGFLATAPLQTIRLYDHGGTVYPTNAPRYHTVLDYFTTFPSNVVSRRGLVNVNTLQTNVLAAVFYKAKKKEYMNLPGGMPGPDDPLDWAAATSIATNIIKCSLGTNVAWGANSWIGRGTYQRDEFTNISRLGSAVLWTNPVSGAPLTNGVLQNSTSKGRTEIAREGPIRNSSGLLTTRQGLFTIYYAVGQEAAGMGTVASSVSSHWLSFNKGVALVWRDPFPDSTRTNHWWFVRWVEGLD